MPRLNPYERFTFGNLAHALASGLDPSFAQSVYGDTLAQAQARRQQQQQVLLGLQQMAYEQAAAGMPESAAVPFIEAMSGTYPFLSGKSPYSQRQQGILDDTFGALYPDQAPVVPNQGIPGGLGTTTPSEVRGGLPPSQAPVPLTQPNPDEGLSPLYTVPRDQEMEAQATAAEQALAQAQAEAQIGLDTQMQGTLQQAQLEQQLPEMLGLPALGEEERMAIGQLVTQRINEGLSLPELRKELMGLTLGMDPAKTAEAEQFAVQAWSQLTGSTQAESTQLTKQFQVALSQSGLNDLQAQAIAQATGGASSQEIAQQLAGVVAANPDLKRALPQILEMFRLNPMKAIEFLLQRRAQAAASAPQQTQMGP